MRMRIGAALQEWHISISAASLNCRSCQMSSHIADIRLCIMVRHMMLVVLSHEEETPASFEYLHSQILNFPLGEDDDLSIWFDMSRLIDFQIFGDSLLITLIRHFPTDRFLDLRRFGPATIQLGSQTLFGIRVRNFDFNPLLSRFCFGILGSWRQSLARSRRQSVARFH